MDLNWVDGVSADETPSTGAPTKEFTFTAGTSQDVYILVLAGTNNETFDLWIQSVSLQQQTTYSGGSAG